MSRDNLLKEAIADAKMVRDAAIANARIQIEEAFAPHMDSLLSKELRKALNEDNDATSGIGGGAVTVNNPGPKMPSAAAHDSSHIENKGIEKDTMGEGVGGDEDLEFDPSGEKGGGATSPTAPAPAAPIAPPAGAAPSVPAVPSAVPGAAPTGAPEQQGAIPGGPEDDILDLEAIIRELELDVGDDAQMGGAPAPGAAPAPAPVPEGFDDPTCGQKVDGPITIRKESTNGANDKDGPGQPAVDGVSGGKKVTPGQSVSQWETDHESVETKEKDHGSLSEELSLDEILREMEAEDGESVTESHAKIVSENAELKRSLRQHIEVIQFMKGKLHEVHMLNSKLLYTNRLFKNFDLNVNQKAKVVETFDRATTVREVKLVYTTLAESYSGRTTGGAKKANAKGIVEGLASKPMGSTKPNTTDAAPSAPKILVEGDSMVARMQKLAGIKQRS